MKEITTVEQWLGEDNQIGIDIWKKKYQHDTETFSEWIDRISNGDEGLRKVILNKKFLFGGRILAYRGLLKKERKITYSNCYVTSVSDSIEGIFDSASKIARTFSYGGGIGLDLTQLAPRGAQINNAAKTTTGAVSFMDLYSMITGLIGQEGRRGALMLSLKCDHPDIEEFIEIKTDLNRVTKANISVRLTDDFMTAVKNKQEYELSYIREATGEVISKKVDAYKLFRKIAKINWDYAEPGVLYWDRVKNYNMLKNVDEFKFAGINPCGELPLPNGGACLLGSINLSSFVSNDKCNCFDYNDFRETVSIAVRALNDVLDEGQPLHPLQEQRNSVRDWRQIGLGIFGLADCLIKMGIAYGSEESLVLCDGIASVMIDQAIKTSAELAKEFGTYPKCNISDIISTDFFQNNTSKNTQKLVESYGLRNSQLLTCAPTGTLSTMIGVSGGIEPIFANYYTRKTESLHSKDVEYKVYTPIVKDFMKKNDITDDKALPDYFITAQNLNYKSRIDMQSIWQNYIDASISSTVNLPHSATIEDIEELYLYAWEQGLKGITVYRGGCKREGILTIADSNNTKENIIKSECKFDCIEPISKDELGETYGTNVKRKVACGKLYINVCRDKDGNLVEIFINTGKGGICQSNTNAISRLVSMSLRSGIKAEEIIDQLKGIVCPACRATSKSEALSGLSCADVIAKTLQEEYDKDEIIIKKNKKRPTTKKKSTKQTEVVAENIKCKECGGELKFEGGCQTCLNCGWSRCG